MRAQSFRKKRVRDGGSARFIRWKILLPILIIAACVGAGFWIYQAQNPRPRGTVPPASASVTVVAKTYLSAAVQQDCGLTRVLTMSNTWAWCDDPRLLSYNDVRPPFFNPALTSGVDEKCVPFTMETTGSSDGSMNPGIEPWSLRFRKTAEGWRLWDQGQGQ